MQRPVLVNCGHGCVDGPKAFFKPHFGDRVEWRFVDANASGRTSWLRAVKRPNIARIWAGVLTAYEAHRQHSDLVISHEPRVTFACEYFLRKLKCRSPHLAFSFNFPKLPVGIRFRQMKAVFQTVDRFLVYSSVERRLYHEAFDIPYDKMDFIFWGVNAPAPDPRDVPLEIPGYICALGENARDYRTLIEAMRQLPDIRAVIVVRPFNIAGITLPSNVEVRTNIPLGHAMNILAFSRFMVLPLAGSEIPCGHVTLSTLR